MRVEKIIPVLFLTALVLLLCCTGAPAVVTISPAFVTLRLDTGRPAGQFVISNTSDQEERYRIKASHFTFGEFGNLTMIPADDNSLAPWIKFNPKEITLPPKSNRTVRFAIVPRQKLQNKEYWAAMELESLKPNVASSDDGEGRSFKILVVPSIVVPIFATNGKLHFEGEIRGIKLVVGKDGTNIECDLVNTGTGHLKVRGSYRIIDDSGKAVAEGGLGSDMVLPNCRRVFSNIIRETIPQGEYRIEVNCASSQLEKPIQHTVKHTW